jgi:hypothetical protein
VSLEIDKKRGGVLKYTSSSDKLDMENDMSAVLGKQEWLDSSFGDLSYTVIPEMGMISSYLHRVQN